MAERGFGEREGGGEEKVEGAGNYPEIKMSVSQQGVFSVWLWGL